MTKTREKTKTAAPNTAPATPATPPQPPAPPPMPPRKSPKPSDRWCPDADINGGHQVIVALQKWRAVDSPTFPKSDSWNRMMEIFSAWFTRQDRNVQWSIVTYAKAKHGFRKYQTDETFESELEGAFWLIDALRDSSDAGDTQSRIAALGISYNYEMSKLPEGAFEGAERIPMTDVETFAEWITAAEAARLLNISRPTFFRRLKDWRLKESLGFHATNDRDGRYELARVLHHAIEYVRLKKPAPRDTSAQRAPPVDISHARS